MRKKTETIEVFSIKSLDAKTLLEISRMAWNTRQNRDFYFEVLDLDKMLKIQNCFSLFRTKICLPDRDYIFSFGEQMEEKLEPSCLDACWDILENFERVNHSAIELKKRWKEEGFYLREKKFSSKINL